MVIDAVSARRPAQRLCAAYDTLLLYGRRQALRWAYSSVSMRGAEYDGRLDDGLAKKNISAFPFIYCCSLISFLSPRDSERIGQRPASACLLKRPHFYDTLFSPLENIRKTARANTRQLRV